MPSDWIMKIIIQTVLSELIRLLLKIILSL